MLKAAQSVVHRLNALEVKTMAEKNFPEEKRQKLNIADIAEELGVSKTTVSRAISGKGRISESTRARVQAYIEKHNYRPNLLARGLAQNKTYNLALVIPKQFSSLDLPFIRKCMRTICETAALRDYDILLSIASDRDTRPIQKLIQNHKVDGVILTRTIENDPYVDVLQAGGVPFVVMGMEREGILQVDNDQVGGCQELTSVLLSKGLGRIALLGGDLEYIVNESRLKGYHKAHEQQGVPVDPDLLVLGLENDGQRLNGLNKALAAKPNCIVCMDDMLADFALKQLTQKGIRVPQDISLASFYDNDLLGELTPPVTALRFDASKLGETACNLLLDVMEGEQAITRIEQGYQVMLRASTQ